MGFLDIVLREIRNNSSKDLLPKSSQSNKNIEYVDFREIEKSPVGHIYRFQCKLNIFAEYF